MFIIDNIIAIGGLVTALTIIGGAVVWLRRVLKGFKNKAEQAFDAINGRDEVLHPETGEVLLESAPGIVQRVAVMEQTQHAIGESIKAIAETNSRLVGLEEQVQQGFEDIKSDKEEAHTALWQAISELKG